jgi:hypothetical protein
LRDEYVKTRLTEDSGQINYYRLHQDRARGWLDTARAIFVWFTFIAVAAAIFKLLVLKDVGRLAEHLGSHATGVLGGVAVFFPVVAVASLSLAAAFDLEARFHTYEQMHELLTRQVKRLNAASSQHEFARLLLETESHLLGETANWFARRSFTGVA